MIETSHGWAVRFYEDWLDQGQRRRRRVQKFLGDFKKLPTKRSAQNAMAGELALVNDFTAQPRTTQTFREFASRWMQSSRTRKRNPAKPSTLTNWQSILDNHVLDVLGELPLSSVGNEAMRKLVERLARKGLSAQTIKNIAQVVKSVKSSAMDEQGNELYPTRWNHDFIDMPVVEPSKQRMPAFTSDQVGGIVKATTGRLQMAAILFAATGLRAGELLGLECRHFDGSAIRVEQAIWAGILGEPKTPNAHRSTDLHPDVASLLKQFLGNRTKGFIFQTRNGRPMNKRNLARSLYNALEKLGIPLAGFHAFRRYRNTFLRNSLCPDGLLKFWMGHAARDMSDRYDRVREDVQFRRDVARSVGIGFELPKALTLTTAEALKRPQMGVNGRQAEVAVSV